MKFLRIIAMLVACVFTVTTVSNSAPSVYNIKIDEKYGKVQKRFKGTSEKTVIHIQDAHASFDAQKNIANIICELIPQIKNSSTISDPFIGIEGAVGEYELSELQSFPDKESRKLVSSDLVHQGKLIGSEMANVISDDKFYLYGLEDFELFKRDYQLFHSVMLKETELEDAVQAFEDELALLKEVLLDEKLKEFLADFKAYQDDNSLIFNFLPRLFDEAKNSETDLLEFTAIVQFKELHLLESKLEKNMLLNELSVLSDQIFSHAGASASLKEKIMEFAKNDLTDGLVLKAYASNLVYAASILNVSLTSFSQVNLYRQYWNKENCFDYMRFASEVENASFKVLQAMTSDVSLLKFIGILRKMFLLKKIIQLKARKEDIDEYRKNKGVYSITAVLDDIKSFSYDAYLKLEGKADGMRDILESSEAFYMYADKRDKAMLDNLIEKMTDKSQDNGVVVAGGYHSEGLLTALKEKGVSFISVIPNISNVQEDASYMDRMMGQISPVNLMLTSTFQLSQINAVYKLAAGDEEFAKVIEEAEKLMPVRGLTSKERISVIIEVLSSSENEAFISLAGALDQIMNREGFDKALFEMFSVSENIDWNKLLDIRDKLDNQVLLNEFLGLFQSEISDFVDEYAGRENIFLPAVQEEPLVDEYADDGSNRSFKRKNSEKGSVLTQLILIVSVLVCCGLFMYSAVIKAKTKVSAYKEVIQNVAEFQENMQFQSKEKMREICGNFAISNREIAGVYFKRDNVYDLKISDVGGENWVTHNIPSGAYGMVHTHTREGMKKSPIYVYSPSWRDILNLLFIGENNANINIRESMISFGKGESVVLRKPDNNVYINDKIIEALRICYESELPAVVKQYVIDEVLVRRLPFYWECFDLGEDDIRVELHTNSWAFICKNIIGLNVEARRSLSVSVDNPKELQAIISDISRTVVDDMKAKIKEVAGTGEEGTTRFDLLSLIVSFVFMPFISDFLSVPFWILLGAEIVAFGAFNLKNSRIQKNKIPGRREFLKQTARGAVLLSLGGFVAACAPSERNVKTNVDMTEEVADDEPNLSEVERIGKIIDISDYNVNRSVPDIYTAEEIKDALIETVRLMYEISSGTELIDGTYLSNDDILAAVDDVKVAVDENVRFAACFYDEYTGKTVMIINPDFLNSALPTKDLLETFLITTYPHEAVHAFDNKVLNKNYPEGIDNQLALLGYLETRGHSASDYWEKQWTEFTGGEYTARFNFTARHYGDSDSAGNKYCGVLPKKDAGLLDEVLLMSNVTDIWMYGLVLLEDKLVQEGIIEDTTGLEFTELGLEMRGGVYTGFALLRLRVNGKEHYVKLHLWDDAVINEETFVFFEIDVNSLGLLEGERYCASDVFEVANVNNEDMMTQAVVIGLAGTKFLEQFMEEGVMSQAFANLDEIEKEKILFSILREVQESDFSGTQVKAFVDLFLKIYMEYSDVRRPAQQIFVAFFSDLVGRNIKYEFIENSIKAMFKQASREQKLVLFELVSYLSHRNKKLSEELIKYFAEERIKELSDTIEDLDFKQEASMPEKILAVQIALRKLGIKLNFQVSDIVDIRASQGILKQLNFNTDLVNILFFGDRFNSDFLASQFPGYLIERKTGMQESSSNINCSFTTIEGKFLNKNNNLDMSVFPWKYSFPSEKDEDYVSKVKEELNIGARPIVVVGSPDSNSFTGIMNVYSEFIKDLPKKDQPLMVFVPRRVKPLKEDAVARLSSGSYAYRNHLQEAFPDMSDKNVLVVNTLGELLDLYSVGDICVLGSDCNVVEPVSREKAILYYDTEYFDNGDALDDIKKAGGARRFSKDNLKLLISDSVQLKEMESNNKRFFADLKDSMEDDKEVLLNYLTLLVLLNEEIERFSGRKNINSDFQRFYNAVEYHLMGVREVAQMQRDDLVTSKQFKSKVKNQKKIILLVQDKGAGANGLTSEEIAFLEKSSESRYVDQVVRVSELQSGDVSLPEDVVLLFAGVEQADFFGLPREIVSKMKSVVYLSENDDKRAVYLTHFPLILNALLAREGEVLLENAYGQIGLFGDISSFISSEANQRMLSEVKNIIKSIVFKTAA